MDITINRSPEQEYGLARRRARLLFLPQLLFPCCLILFGLSLYTAKIEMGGRPLAIGYFHGLSAGIVFAALVWAVYMFRFWSKSVALTRILMMKSGSIVYHINDRGIRIESGTYTIEYTWTYFRFYKEKGGFIFLYSAVVSSSVVLHKSEIGDTGLSEIKKLLRKGF